MSISARRKNHCFDESSREFASPTVRSSIIGGEARSVNAQRRTTVRERRNGELAVGTRGFVRYVVQRVRKNSKGTKIPRILPGLL